MSGFRAAFSRRTTDDDVTSVNRSTVVDNKQENTAGDVPADHVPDEAQPDAPTEGAQRGVHNVEAVTLTWSKKSLIAVFIKCVPRFDRVCPLLT